MTNSKTRNAVSRPAALAFVIEHFADEIPEDTMKALTDWHAALTKKRATGEPTKEQRANAELLDRVIETISAYGQPVTARWVFENVPGIMTIQKASSLMRKGVADNRLIADVDKKRTEYTVA